MLFSLTPTIVSYFFVTRLLSHTNDRAWDTRIAMMTSFKFYDKFFVVAIKLQSCAKQVFGKMFMAF